MTKEQAFSKLYELINYYYENRDQPAEPGFNFHEELEKNCQILGLDEKVIIEEFKLNSL